MGSWSLGMVSFLSLVLSSYVSAQSGSAPIGNTASFPASMDTTFRQMGDKFVASGRSDGLSIAVVYQGQVHFYNFGVISRSKRKAPTQRTVYEIGSISKAFTSLLLAHAVSDGKVRIDDDIRKYLPGNYPKLEFDGTPVHLVDLVDHTSALPDNLPVPTDELKKMKPQESTFRVNEILANYTVADMLRDLSESSLDHRPGTEPRHSNVSMEVLAAVLENVYHDSYPHLLSHYIEKPFGMAAASVTHGGRSFPRATTKNTARCRSTPGVLPCPPADCGTVRKTWPDSCRENWVLRTQRSA